MNLVQYSIERKESATIWQTINEISRKKNSTKAKLKATNEKEMWKNHFQNLLGKPDINNLVFTE